MGDRYYLTVICPKCGHNELEVYYAPTCGFSKCKCNKCREVIDLAEYTGISYEDCSNLGVIECICKIIQQH